MKQRRRRRSEPSREEGVTAAGREQVESGPDGDWVVRPVTGSAATKMYRCPGCDHEIRPATPHLVIWPAEEGGIDERRHWHRACWRARDRRRLKSPRPRNGPKP